VKCLRSLYSPSLASKDWTWLECFDGDKRTSLLLRGYKSFAVITSVSVEKAKISWKKYLEGDIKIEQEKEEGERERGGKREWGERGRRKEERGGRRREGERKKGGRL
jgi:hypothetical protein